MFIGSNPLFWGSKTCFSNQLDVFGDGSCVELYKFNDTLLSESGLYDGIGTDITYSTGKEGSAATFNGTTSQVSSLIHLNSASAVSFHMYVSSINFYDKILTEGLLANNYTVIDLSSTGTLRAISDSRDLVGGTIELISDVSPISTGAWIHVGVNFENTLELFKDGSSLGSSAISVKPDNMSGTVLGYRLNSAPADTHFNGMIDNLRFFNRELSQSEFLKLATTCL